MSFFSVGRFFKVGNTISFHYFGQPVELELIDISGQSDTKDTSQEHKPVTDLTDNLQKMKLDESQSQSCHEIENENKFYQTQSITKVSIVMDRSKTAKASKQFPSLNEIGGLETQMKMLQELVDLQLKNMGYTQKQGEPFFVQLFNYYQLNQSVIIKL